MKKYLPIILSIFLLSCNNHPSQKQTNQINDSIQQSQGVHLKFNPDFFIGNWKKIKQSYNGTIKYAPFKDTTQYTESVLTIYKPNEQSTQYSAIRTYNSKVSVSTGGYVLYPDTMRWDNVFNKHKADFFDNMVILSGSPPQTFRIEGEGGDTLIEYFYQYNAVHNRWTLPSMTNVNTWVRTESN